ncbi:unnamed protein product [Caenorhabditis bovis]|uniref:snRNA-activating protein complex subunit 4 n=1 Tax=Caenorhabditis bovis TaxID=2654633 RepID=A0A8S1FCF2_9PELO|nr:unnamed protein product [Caenorhabditis bovis]
MSESVNEGASSSSQQDCFIECADISGVIAVNEAYMEVLKSIIDSMEGLLRENLEKQRLLKEEMQNMSTCESSKRKVPVHQYMPPYFKDENGMCPPLSAEGRLKLEMNIFDPLMKEEKKWTPAELKTLREAVRESLISIMVQPFVSKRDVLVSKLKAANMNTTNAERAQWTHELEETIRKINYLRERREEEVITPSADYSKVAWNEIANVNFKGTRTEWAVRTKWLNEMSPKWNKGPWTVAEVERLRELRESPRFVSWPMLAMALDTRRTPFQCLEKYKSEVALQSKEWTQEEDQKLITLTSLLSKNGNIQWDKVAQFMPGRTRQQVRTRFSHTLDTDVKHGRWTDQEDLLLICSVSRHGARDWSKVAQAVPGRNDSQCRERWCNVLNRPANISEIFTFAEDEKLLYTIKVFGKGNWTKCAQFFKKKTPKQLRRRYIQLIAAKLKTVAGYCSAAEAMGNQPVEPTSNEDEFVANEKMNKVFSMYAEYADCTDSSAEELMKRVRDKYTPRRYSQFKNSPNWPEIEKQLKNMVETENMREFDVEKRANDVLKMLSITDLDVRHMVAVSRRHLRYTRAGRTSWNVDSITNRIRPTKHKIEITVPTMFQKEVPESERQMCLIEALCQAVRRHDHITWGRDYYSTFQCTSFPTIKVYLNRMLTDEVDNVANHILEESNSPMPVKSTLAPVLPTVLGLDALNMTRAQLQQIASKHFLPLDVSIETRNRFQEEDRLSINANQRLNIQLSSEITKSREYATFYAKMRALFLEPCRLKIAKETPNEERLRLQRELLIQARNVEEECGTIPKKTNAFKECVDLPEIEPILKDGIRIDTRALRQIANAKLDSTQYLTETINGVVEKARKACSQPKIEEAAAIEPPSKKIKRDNAADSEGELEDFENMSSSSSSSSGEDDDDEYVPR